MDVPVWLYSLGFLPGLLFMRFFSLPSHPRFFSLRPFYLGRVLRISIKGKFNLSKISISRPNREFKIILRLARQKMGSIAQYIIGNSAEVYGNGVRDVPTRRT